MPEVERDLWTLRESAASQFGRPGAYRGRRDLLRAMLPRLFGGEIMIGWKPPAKAKRRETPQEMGIKRAKARADIKTYMAKADVHDEANYYWADLWLQQRRENGEDHHRTVFALNYFARRHPEIEI
jgi:hypothetical protein